MIDNTASGLKKQIEEEIQRYTTGVVQVGENYDYSQFKLVRRIHLFETQTYPTGKFDAQGNYKYWFNMSSPRIDAEVKNIDFDVKDFTVTSDRDTDDLANIIINLRLKQYCRETGQSEEINDAVEEGSGWGNIVWKKVKKSYERTDLKNFYVINQTAKTLDETPVIERHQFSNSDLRSMKGTWDDDNIKAVLQNLQQNSYKEEIQTTASNTTVPYYEIYERNGEVCLKDLKEANGETLEEGDEDEYVFARIIAAASKGTAAGTQIEYILYAEAMPGKDNCDFYKEFHRGRYEGRWFRKGIYEMLFDLQVRGNMIGNQIAQGLEYASKIIFNSPDKQIIQNVLSDMKNGDVIRSANFTQVQVRMEGFDQLVADWNRIQQLANDLTNSNQIVQGALPSNISFRLGQMLNQNSNKLYDFIREKLSIPYSAMFEEWNVPNLIKDLKAQDILNLTGDTKMLERLFNMIVDDWYISNLIAIGPHSDLMAQTLKSQKLDELKKRPSILMKEFAKAFKDYEPHVVVDVAGDRNNTDIEMQTLGTFIGMEQDPVRRTALIEMAMKKKGLDVAGLPKSPPPTQTTIQMGSGNQPVPSPLQPQTSDPYPAPAQHAVGYVGGSPIYR